MRELDEEEGGKEDGRAVSCFCFFLGVSAREIPWSVSKFVSLFPHSISCRPDARPAGTRRGEIMADGGKRGNQNEITKTLWCLEGAYGRTDDPIE